MGARGPGAARQRRAREQAESKKRKLPWLRQGLSRPERVIKFCQWLPITKGKRAGKRMRLLPEQRQFIEDVYGPATKAGRRQVSIAVMSLPKGNGKTGLVAALALCHLLGPEAEPRGEVYSAAIDRGQAAITFNEMEAIILEVPEFAARVNIQRFHKKIEDQETGSVYEALSQDARRAHGLAPSFWVYDELAQAKGRELLDNLMNGMSKRDECLGLVISTQAESDLHALSELIDDAQSGEDPSMYCLLLSAPEEADPFDETVQKACNPAWGKFLDMEDFRRVAGRAQRMPSQLPAFKNLRLNQRIDLNVAKQFLTKAQWRSGNVPVDLESLRGRECYGGLDLSAKRDLSSLELVFPDYEDDIGYDVLSFFWTPGDTLKERAHNDRAPYELWVDQGHLEATPGAVIKYKYIARKLAALVDIYDIKAIGYDRWRIEEFKSDLAEEQCEVELEPFGQGFRDMGPALDYLAEVVLDARLRHGGHPVLTWCFSNAITVKDPAHNQKFDKEKARNRIDGAVALAMAIGTAKRFVDDGGPETVSFWETVDAA